MPLLISSEGSDVCIQPSWYASRYGKKGSCALTNACTTAMGGVLAMDKGAMSAAGEVRELIPSDLGIDN